MSCGNNSNNCVCEVVRAILEIQNAATDDCVGCTTNCFMEPLGGIVSPARTAANTRVFTLSTKTGAPFFATFASADFEDACISVFFRVEDVFDDCCATLRVLVPLDGPTGDPTADAVDLVSDDGRGIDIAALCDVEGFALSDSCITVDLGCFCAVQCIADVELDVC